MSKAFKLCNGSKDFSNDEMDHIHFYMAIRSIIYKLTKGKAPDTDQMNSVVKKMITEAIRANDVEELFTESTNVLAGTVDLFDKRYLEKINKIALPNTKVKILQQLLSQAIDEFKKVNKIKAISFSERLQAVIDSYNSRTLDDAQITQIMHEVAEQLVGLMEELKTEKDSFDELGINYEEKAFYDVLVAVEDKYDFDFPDDKNVEIAKQIYQLVTEKGKYADWTNRADIKAELQCDIIELLADNGFPPRPEGTIENYDEVYNDVLEQTENFKKYYVE